MKAGLLKSAAYPKYKGDGAFCGIVLQFKAVLSLFLSRPGLVSLPDGQTFYLSILPFHSFSVGFR